MLACQRSGFFKELVRGSVGCCEITVDREGVNDDQYNINEFFEQVSVELTAVDLAKDVTRYYVFHIATQGQARSDRPVNRYSVTLRRVADTIVDQHSILLDGLVRKLNLTDGNVDDVVRAFQTTVDGIYADGVCNWGRLGTVYAFAGVLLRHSFQSRRVVEDDLDDVAARIGTHIARKTGTWIRSNGGWVRFFDV